jgi:regulator of sigma E protease
MIFIWIIVAFTIFSIIVLVHEFWHFKAARLFWVKVEEFGLWIPPRIKKIWKDKKWTIYTLNYIPLWGFVKLSWELPININLYDKKWKLYNYKSLKKRIKQWLSIYDKRNNKLSQKEINEVKKIIQQKESPFNLNKKPAWQQIIIILAGVFMNFLFSFIIFSILFFVWVKPIWINTKIETNLNTKLIPTYSQAINSGLLIQDSWVIVSPIKWSIAKQAWLKEFDVITSINWENILNTKDLINKISNNKNKEIEIKGFRQDKDNTFKLKLIVGENWKIWSYIWENIKLNTNFKYKYSLLESIKYWFLETYNESLLTLKALWNLLEKVINPKDNKERQEVIKEVSWPIWLINFISNSLSAGFIFLLILSAIISLNLWVFNLLPIPALDWGRFIFIILNSILQKIFWRNINQNIEAIIHAIFFISLIALSLVIGYNDIIKIINN